MDKHRHFDAFQPARRQYLRAGAAGVAGLALAGCARPATEPSVARVAGQREAQAVASKLAFEVPAGACDCHVHVFPETHRFPFWPGRTYTPPTATVGQLLDLQQQLHMNRVVIVQPSVYGTDNRATLDGIAALGLQRARGIAVVAPDTRREALDMLWRQGMRGVRVNLEAGGVQDPGEAGRRLDAAIAMIRGTGMHLQVFARLPLIAALHGRLARLPVPAVFDHFAGVDASRGIDQPGFAEVLDLVRRGTAYVKVSAAYRVSTQAPGYVEVAPFARELVRSNPARVLWGTDWPHPGPAGARSTDIATPYAVDNAAMLNLLADWVPQAGLRQKILVDNPGRLYGF